MLATDYGMLDLMESIVLCSPAIGLSSEWGCYIGLPCSTQVSPLWEWICDGSWAAVYALGYVKYLVVVWVFDPYVSFLEHVALFCMTLELVLELIEP